MTASFIGASLVGKRERSVDVSARVAQAQRSRRQLDEGARAEERAVRHSVAEPGGRGRSRKRMPAPARNAGRSRRCARWLARALAAGETRSSRAAATAGSSIATRVSVSDAGAAPARRDARQEPGSCG